MPDPPGWAAGIRHARSVLGLSQRDLARQLDTAASLDSRIRAVKRWETGAAPPSEHYAAQLDEVLGSSWRGSTVEDMDRRRLLATAAGVGIGALTPASARASVDGLATALDGLRELEDAAGPALAIRPAEVLAQAAESLVRDVPASARTTAVRWVAELCTYSAHLRTLAGDLAGARPWCDRAVAAAQECGQPLTLAHAYGKRAVLAQAAGQLETADRAAAACVAAGAGPHPTASYTLVRATVAARRGDEPAARRLLAAGERAAARLGELEATMPWSLPRYYPASVAEVLAALGDPAAPGLAADAVAGWPDRWRRAVWARGYMELAAS